ncbi:hypothetical protein [Candidatus Methylacidiphilum infernorum]|nr:hypothetical protein [Candidatus Methylacidiphilum infernorum]
MELLTAPAEGGISAMALRMKVMGMQYSDTRERLEILGHIDFSFSLSHPG